MILNQFSITNIFMIEVERRIFMLTICSSFQKKNVVFKLWQKKNFVVENINTTQIMIDMTIEKSNFIVK